MAKAKMKVKTVDTDAPKEKGLSAREISRSKPGRDDLSKLIASVQEDMGGAARIVPLHTVRTPYDIRRPTGISDLDQRMNGGFPAGTLNQIFGADGSGKDLLTNHIIAENQRIHGDKANAFWMSFGYLPDIPFMRMCGVQIEHGRQRQSGDVGQPDDDVLPEVLFGDAVTRR